MARTVVGLFDEAADARRAVQELEASGFGAGEISVLAHDAARADAGTVDAGDRAAGAAGGAVKGAAGGALWGGATGLLAGLAALMIPGIGPVLAVGPLTAALTGAAIGAAGGGILGGLTGLGVPREHAELYAEALRRGGTLVTVQADEAQAQRAIEILDRHGAVDIEQRGASWRQSGYAGYSESAPPYTAAQITRERESYRSATASSTTVVPGTTSREGETVIPVVEEELTVGKRAVERGGARVRTYVTEQPVEEAVRLREEHVTVERHAVDRPASTADLDTFREGSIELTERAEEAVVSKQARVVEEVVIGKEATERVETVRDTVRRTEVDVEEIAPGRTAGASDFSAYESDFRGDFPRRFASSSGATYEEYQPAYRYGHELAGNSRYAGRDWANIAPEVRRDWEARHAGSAWERFQDSVRFAWDRARGTASAAASGNRVPGVQTGGRAADGTPDTRGLTEKATDAVTGDRIDDKTGKPVR